jgi:hypothetical protein
VPEDEKGFPFEGGAALNAIRKTDSPLEYVGISNMLIMNGIVISFVNIFCGPILSVSKLYVDYRLVY